MYGGQHWLPTLGNQDSQTDHDQSYILSMQMSDKVSLIESNIYI